MRRSLHRRTMAICLPLVMACLTACGSTKQGGETACLDLVSALCSKVAECSETRFVETYGDVAGCIGRESVIFSQLQALPGTSWTSTQFAACASNLRTAS